MLSNPIIVTGATGGIGREITEKLIAKEYHIIAIGRKIELLNEEFNRVDNIKYLEYDLNNLDGIPMLIKNIKKEFGPIGGFIHCAGFDKMAPLYLAKVKDTKNLFNIHVFAPMAICSQLNKKGVASNDCSVVLISSLASHEGAKGHTSYAAAKGALEGFLPSAASEMADKNIRLNIVVPGIVETKMSKSYIGKMDSEQIELMNRSYPLGIGSPTDVANCIEFLISDKSRWITGQKIFLDGGHMCRKV